MKKNILFSLGFASLLVLTSCGSNLTYEQARQWVIDNYPSAPAPIEIKSYTFKWDFSKVTGEKAKSLTKQFLSQSLHLVDPKLNGEATLPSSGEKDYGLSITSFDVRFPFKNANNLKFFVSNKDLKVTEYYTAQFSSETKTYDVNAIDDNYFNSNSYQSSITTTYERFAFEDGSSEGYYTVIANF